MLHIPPTNLLLLAAKQEPYKTTCLLTKNIEDFLGKVQENGPGGIKKKDETSAEVISFLVLVEVSLLK